MEKETETEYKASFPEIVRLWNIYCLVQRSIADAMGRTDNIVGEFGEQLVAKYYGVEQEKASHAAYDMVITEQGVEKKVQVKSSLSGKVKSTQLSDIGSLEIDYLVAVIFSPRSGKVVKAGRIKREKIEELLKQKEEKKEKKNKEKKGNGRKIISTTDAFWMACDDLTEELNKLLKQTTDN